MLKKSPPQQQPTLDLSLQSEMIKKYLLERSWKGGAAPRRPSANPATRRTLVSQCLASCKAPPQKPMLPARQ